MSETLPNPQIDRYIRLVRSVFELDTDEELIGRVRRGAARMQWEALPEPDIMRHFDTIGIRPMRDAVDRLAQQPGRAQQLIPLVDRWMAISGLTNFEKTTIERRFGLGLNERPMKRGEIAQADHVVGGTVNQRLHKAFIKLRREDHAQPVKDFLQSK